MDTISSGNGRRLQARKPRKDGFTDAKRQIVLDQLAGCANLSRAAAAAGVTTVTVNYHRRRDPAFRQQVIEAIEAGYEALEAMAIDYATTGKAYQPGDTAVPGPETMDPNVALHLLRLRRAPPGQRTGRAGYEPKRASEKELTESILAKLDLLDRRLRPRRDQARKLKTRAAVAAVAALRDDEAGRPVPRTGLRTSGGDPHLLISASSAHEGPGLVPRTSPEGPLIQDERGLERGDDRASTGSALAGVALRDGASAGSAPPQDERNGDRASTGSALAGVGGSAHEGPRLVPRTSPQGPLIQDERLVELRAPAGAEGERAGQPGG